MIQFKAAEIAGRVSKFYIDTLGRSSEEAVRIQSAVFHLAYEFIPDDAIADLVVLDRDKAPVILAIDGTQLYILSAKPKGDDDIIPAICRTICLTPNTDTVKVETKHWGTGDLEPAREVVWRFDFADDAPVTLKTTRSAEGVTSGPEDLAQALASAIGWKSPLADANFEKRSSRSG